jgi:nucleoside-diphosphate-sugar epimerase
MTSKKTISILGCGWYGLPLAIELTSCGYLVKGSTTTSAKLETMQEKGIIPFLIDLNNLTSTNDGFWDADRLIITLPPSGHPEEFEKKIQLLAAITSQHRYDQLIVISSTSVYPDENGTVLEEHASYQISSHSGISLLKYENLLFKSNTCIIRFGGLFGPNRHPVKSLSGRELSGGSAPVNLIHRSDCIAITLSIIKQGIVNTRLNACHPDHPSRTDYYTMAAQRLGIPPPVFSTEPTAFKKVSSEKLIRRINYQFSKKLQIT